MGSSDGRQLGSPGFSGYGPSGGASRGSGGSGMAASVRHSTHTGTGERSRFAGSVGGKCVGIRRHKGGFGRCKDRARLGVRCREAGRTLLAKGAAAAGGDAWPRRGGVGVSSTRETTKRRGGGRRRQEGDRQGTRLRLASVALSLGSTTRAPEAIRATHKRWGARGRSGRPVSVPAQEVLGMEAGSQSPCPGVATDPCTNGSARMR